MPGHVPTGTVTFLFTDIEASTRLLRELGPDVYAEALAEHAASCGMRSTRSRSKNAPNGTAAAGSACHEQRPRLSALSLL
jgi:hypothetical protein